MPLYRKLTTSNELNVLDAVEVATTANITLSGEQTIDGITTSTDRVLVKDQTDASENGVYVSAAGAWSRALDTDTWDELLGAIVLVNSGTTNGGTQWASQSTSGGTLGTSNIPFTKFGNKALFPANNLDDVDSALTSRVNLGISIDTKADFEAATVPSDIKTVELRGSGAFGDANGGLFKRVDSEPSHGSKVRSTDRFLSTGVEDATNGGWWESFSTVGKEFRVENYIDPAQMAFIMARDSAGQDAATVVTGLRAMFDAGMAAMNGDDDICVVFKGPPGTYAINDEIFSETWAQNLWDSTGTGSSYFVFDFTGWIFQVKGWSSHKAVRTSGWYAARSITDPVPTVVFRFEQGSTSSLGPIILGSPMIRGELATTDPIGWKFRQINGAQCYGLRTRRLLNTPFFCEVVNNSAFFGGDFGSSGFQPTQAGGDGFLSTSVTFSGSSGAATITASEAVFVSDHVGKWFLLEGAGSGSSGFAAKVVTVDSTTQITVDRNLTQNASSVAGSFIMITGSTTAASDQLVLDTEVTTDLVGRYVSVWKAGSNTFTEHDVLTTRVTAQAADNKTLTLATNAANTVSSQPVCVAPSFYLGKSDDMVDGAGTASTAQNNDTKFFGLSIEHWFNPAVGGAVLSVMQTVDEVSFYGRKLHGTLQQNNNFGACGMSGWFDNVSHVEEYASVFSIGDWHPEFGRLCFSGERTFANFHGLTFGNGGTDFTALWYMDPQSSGVANTQVWYSGRNNMVSTRWNLTNQDFIRLGTNGQANQLRSNGPFYTRAVAGYTEERPQQFVVTKDGTQTVNNSTTLVSDNALKVSISPNETLLIWFSLRYNSNSTADFKFTFAGPSGAAGSINVSNPRTRAAGSAGGSGHATLGTTIDYEGFGFEGGILGSVLVVNGATAGDVELQWAQNTADVSDTTVLARSSLFVTRGG